jgi:hypothetical protein
MAEAARRAQGKKHMYDTSYDDDDDDDYDDDDEEKGVLPDGEIHTGGYSNPVSFQALK